MVDVFISYSRTDLAKVTQLARMVEAEGYQVRAYHDGADMGITVHHVNEQVDAGHVVLQKTVVPGRLVKNLSFESAEQKMHQAEYALVRRAVERAYA